MLFITNWGTPDLGAKIWEVWLPRSCVTPSPTSVDPYLDPFQMSPPNKFKKTMVQLKSSEGYLRNINEPLVLRVISLDINSEPLVWEHQFPIYFGG